MCEHDTYYWFTLERRNAPESWLFSVFIDVIARGWWFLCSANWIIIESTVLCVTRNAIFLFASLWWSVLCYRSIWLCLFCLNRTVVLQICHVVRCVSNRTVEAKFAWIRINPNRLSSLSTTYLLTLNQLCVFYESFIDVIWIIAFYPHHNQFFADGTSVNSQ